MWLGTKINSCPPIIWDVGSASVIEVLDAYCYSANPVMRRALLAAWSYVWRGALKGKSILEIKTGTLLCLGVW